MKTILFSLLFTLSFSGIAQTNDDIKEAVFQLGKAMLDENVEALRALTSTQLNYGHSSGAIENQEQFLAVFASKNSDYQTWDIYDLEISQPQKNLALVRHKVKGSIVSNGTTNNLQIGLLMVWTKEKGSWKLLARQAYRLPQTQ
jgi:hypothetical protein